jgi:hypothetical protein
MGQAQIHPAAPHSNGVGAWASAAGLEQGRLLHSIRKGSQIGGVERLDGLVGGRVGGSIQTTEHYPGSEQKIAVVVNDASRAVKSGAIPQRDGRLSHMRPSGWGRLKNKLDSR